MARKKKAVLEDERDEQSEDVTTGGGSIRLGEFGSAVLQLAEEKGISEDKVIEVVEAALSAAYKKDYGKRGQVIRAEFDRESKTAKYFLVKEVVDETTREFVDESEEEMESVEGESKQPEATEKPTEIVGDAAVMNMEDEKRLPRFNAERDVTLEEARETKPHAEVGDIIETGLEAYAEFGRVAAQTAKQVIIQRIREAERESMFAEYKGKEGQVVNGIVQRLEGRLVFVDLGKSVGVMFPSDQVDGENYRIGQRVKVLISRVEADAKGPGITLSRSHPDMVRHLFSLEVPEIFAGTVEIKAISREAGSRTKIAVSTSEEGVDPIGSCVGQKGTRVQAVIDELGGEKIDIIEWSDDVEKFIKAALSPAKVSSVELDEATKTALVHVPEDQLSLAIGRRGQNVRLASKLVGWKIDIAGSGSRKDSREVENGEQSANIAPQIGEGEGVEEKMNVAVEEEDLSKETEEAVDTESGDK